MSIYAHFSAPLYHNRESLRGHSVKNKQLIIKPFFLTIF